jgi:hypothetical protein
MERIMKLWTRRDVLRTGASLAPFVLQSLNVEALNPATSAPCIGRILSAEYLESQRRLILTAEEGPAPLVADDLIVLTRAVTNLTAQQSTILFSMEPVGSQMLPFFSPKIVGPTLDRTECALVLTDCDLFLKAAALGLANFWSSDAGPSEIDLMAADLLRKVRRGETVSNRTSVVHRLYFVLSLPNDTHLSPDWLTVSYPDALIDVVSSLDARQESSPDTPEQMFAAMVKAKVGVLANSSSTFARLRNMFLMLKIADWMLRDIRVPIDRELLASYATRQRQYPVVPIERASRTITHQDDSFVVTLAGGVVFDLQGPLKRTARDTWSGVYPRNVIAAGSSITAQREPPPVPVESVHDGDRRLVRVDVSELFGLKKTVKGERV